MRGSNKKLIVSVCRGNIARSPLAETIIRKELERRGLHDQYETLSRGTQGLAPNDGEPVKFRNITSYSELYQDVRSWLDERGIDLSAHVSTPIDRDIAERTSVMFAMDRQTQQTLVTLFPDQAQKIHKFSELVGNDKDVIDPESVSGREAREQIFAEVENTIVQGFPQLLAFADSMKETATEIVDNQPEGMISRREERK